MSVLTDLQSEATDYCLGVSQSASGQAWIRRPYIPRLAELIASQFKLNAAAAELVAGRGIDIEDCDRFLNPSLKYDLPDPFVLQGMEDAVHYLSEAVISGKKIAIFGDYDVDGATSTSLFIRYFAELNIMIDYHIPDREKEGYGPNEAALLGLQQRGADCVITVDCGSLSFLPLEAAKNAGLDVIILDHHKCEPILPPSVAVVNPNRLDDDSGLGYLAAVGVCFMTLVALSRALREKGYFKTNSLREPNLLQLLDMVALGTVCDVVPLVGVNRSFVAQGLKVMHDRRNVGLTALADVGGVDDKVSTYHLGFILGPRINAGGRVGQSDLGVKLLTAQDYAFATSVATELDGYNKDRQFIEKTVLEEALEQAERRYGIDGQPSSIVIVAGEGWHQGVIGIVASRLKEKYGVPAIVIAIDEHEAKGSGRSITGVDLGAAVIEAVQAGHLTKGGGHAMAAGMSLQQEQLDAFIHFMEMFLEKDIQLARLSRQLKIDSIVAPSAITAQLVESFDKVGPFGVGNPGPMVAMENVTLLMADRVGANHVRCRFKGRDGTWVKCMAFRIADESMGQILLNNVGASFHVVGKIKKDSWAGGDKAEMTIEDVFFIK